MGKGKVPHPRKIDLDRVASALNGMLALLGWQAELIRAVLAALGAPTDARVDRGIPRRRRGRPPRPRPRRGPM